MHALTNRSLFLQYFSFFLLVASSITILLHNNKASAGTGDFVWARAMGGTSSDYGLRIFIDSSDNIYTTGNFSGTADFDPGPAISSLTSQNFSNDIFISKLNKNGDFVWAKSLGGASSDSGQGIFVDSSGNVYTAGTFFGTIDLDPGPGTTYLTSAGNGDIFISKLNSNGDFIWGKAVGGTLGDYGEGIAVDSSGNVYICGYFNGTADFNPGPDLFNLTSAGNDDIFVSKLDSDGNFVWAKAMGGNQYDYAWSFTLDSSANIYITGRFGGTADFDPGPGIANLISSGSTDIFICKLSSNGELLWAKAMGGSELDEGFGVSVDLSGNVYTTGNFNGTADFDPSPGTAQLISTGGTDIFISKLNSLGSFVWAKALGGASADNGKAIAADKYGNVYTTGNFNGTADFDPGPGATQLISAGDTDIFISKLNSLGGFAWAKAMGGSATDLGNDIAVSSSGISYVSGYFSSTADFDPGPEISALTSAGLTDIFISKLAGSDKFPWPQFLPSITIKSQ